MPDEPVRSPVGAQVAVRVDANALARLDALAARLSRPGLDLTRADALRVAMMTGLGVLDKEEEGVRVDAVGARLSVATVPPAVEPRETVAPRAKGSPPAKRAR